MSEPPRSPSPSVASASGSVEVTGVLAVTATMDSEPKWTLSKVANDLHSHLSDSAQQLLDLDSPVDLRGLDIFKSASVQPGGLQKPITEAVKADEEEAKYLIMFDLPPDHANIVETCIKNKENLAIACGDHPVKEEVEQKAKKGKGKKKGKAVESGSTSSQISKSTKPSLDDTLASIIQRLDTLQTSNEQLMELNNKLLEKSAGWGSSITNLNSTADKLKVSDAKLEASNNKLMEKSAGWGSSITNLNSTVDKLKASDAKLEASNTKLEEASNTKLEAASNAKLEAASNAKLEKELAKERDDRKAERDSLEERLEKQDRSFMAKLAEEREARKRDIQSISELTITLIPLHLRVLLDRTRQKILDILQITSWEDIVNNQTLDQTTSMIERALEQARAQHPNPPVRDAIYYLCSYNNVRRDGNYHAHNASEEEMRNAVLTKPTDSQDRVILTQFLQFVFGSSV